MTELTKECRYCKKTFSKPYSESLKAWHNRHFYCSKPCADKGRIGMKMSEEAKAKQRASSTGRKHTPEAIAKMSGENSPAWKGGKPKCIDCGEKVKNPYAKRCGKCQKKFQKGENAANWRGGITPINAKIRNSEEMKLWRLAVFTRDDYTCVWCGKRGVTLHADHIKPFAHYPELRFAIDNGRTLCVACHRTTDTYGGKIKK